MQDLPNQLYSRDEKASRSTECLQKLKEESKEDITNMQNPCVGKK